MSVDNSEGEIVVDGRDQTFDDGDSLLNLNVDSSGQREVQTQGQQRPHHYRLLPQKLEGLKKMNNFDAGISFGILNIYSVLPVRRDIPFQNFS